MIQHVTYGFFGEDAAQRKFLSMYLTQQYAGQFIESEEFGWRIKVTNKDQVDSQLSGALLVRRDLRLDVLFIGRDTDSPDPKSVQIHRARLMGICKNQPAIMLLIPVQCVEHWLWYLKRYKESPGVNKPLEPYKRSEAKEVVYGSGTLTTAKRLDILVALFDNFDANWLESRSESFRIFRQEVEKYVSEQTITPS